MTVFLDTNILLYAHDEDAGERHQKARRLIDRLRETGELPFVSIQVLQEMVAVLIRRGVARDVVREMIEHYLQWNIVENTCELMRRTLDVQQRFQLSFWDANSVAAAQQAGASELWTEDLNAGQDYGGVRAVNPFSQGGGAATKV
jgi:predicted nucleic acid-binding protein